MLEGMVKLIYRHALLEGMVKLTIQARCVRMYGKIDYTGTLC